MEEASSKTDRIQLIIHDDDDTPHSFVIGLVRTVFKQPQANAIAITRMIEQQGKVTFGPYERAIGETMLRKAQARVREAKLSLRITSERVAAASDLCHWCEEAVGEVVVQLSGKTRLYCEECIDEIARRAPGFMPHRQEYSFAFEVIQRHFELVDYDELVSTTRQFPAHMRADLQAALDELFSAEPIKFFGIRQHYSNDTLFFAKLCEDRDGAYALAAAQFLEIDVGDVTAIKCLRNGLWLGSERDFRYAAVLSPHRNHDEDISISIEITVPDWAGCAEFVQNCFTRLESAINTARVYRGKILSFDGGADYRGRSRGLMVHKLPSVARDEVILPEATTSLLDRNVLRFVEAREQLRALRLSTRKGILLYGPPGTGKTHTIRYLASNLPGHTTLIITAAQMALLGHYMTLARLLQPALVVIEDVDLIARDRDQMRGGCEEPLLNQLLNEMDGLKEDADIIFVLTTNRPEQLESALASRPGRIDQAIEVPLPDAAGRRKLIQLYGRGLALEEQILDDAAQRTKGVSAAFIKELMRRTAQGCIARSGGSTVQASDIAEALDDMLFGGGRLNLKLLGGAQEMAQAR